MVTAFCDLAPLLPGFSPERAVLVGLLHTDSGKALVVAALLREVKVYRLSAKGQPSN